MKEIKNILIQAEFLKKSNWIQAVSILEDAVIKYPNSTELWQKLANIYLDKNGSNEFIEKAKRCLLKIVSIDENNDDANFKLGNCWLTLGDSAKSIHFYYKVKEKYPEAKYNIAIAYTNLNQYEEAAAELVDLIKDNNVSVPAYLFLADIYINEKKFDEALQVLEKMEKKFGTSGDILYRKGMCNLYKSYFLKAYYEFKKAFNVKHSSAKFFHAFGIATEKIGRLEEAIVYLEKSIELAPSASFAYRDLITIFIKKKEYKRALKVADKAKKYPEIATFVSLLRQKLLFLIEEEDKNS